LNSNKKAALQARLADIAQWTSVIGAALRGCGFHNVGTGSSWSA
jgi:hypothetical protein